MHEGYGIISHDELIKAVDSMTFDQGETEILVATDTDKKSRQRITASAGTRKNTCKPVRNTRTNEWPK